MPEKRDVTALPLGFADLTLRCPVCDRRADMCFDHGDDWKKRSAHEAVVEIAEALASALDDRNSGRDERGWREVSEAFELTKDLAAKTRWETEL